jgi:hypothetical protein
MTDHLAGLLRRRRLNYCQIKTITSVLLEQGTGFSELDQKRASLALAPRKAVKVAQQGRLMLTAE